LEQISNISFHSNIVFTQKLGLIYDTYMSMLGFRQAMYDNLLAVKAVTKKKEPEKTTLKKKAKITTDNA